MPDRPLVCYASTLFGAMTLAAALDEGHFASAEWSGARDSTAANSPHARDNAAAEGPSPRDSTAVRGLGALDDDRFASAEWSGARDTTAPRNLGARDSITAKGLGTRGSTAARRRRVLLVSTNATIPEITPELTESPCFAALRDRFDEVLSWNRFIEPLHPAEWKPRGLDVPIFTRLLRDRFGEPVELVLESIPVPPTRTLAGLLRDCPITVYSGGLMDYGPTGDALPREIAGRITRLLHLDLVPGLTPLSLSEYGVPGRVVSGSSFDAVLRQAVDQVKDAVRCSERAPVVILGQCLASLGILTPAEEAGLHERLLRALAAQGHRRVLFKPHPAAGRRHARELRPVAAELGLDLVVADQAIPAEVLFATHRPELVTGCFSTALLTARRFFGIPIAAMGGELVLERLTPYENGDRVPATIVDATVPRLREDGTIEQPPPVDLTALVSAVNYCMRSTTHPGLRDTALAYLREHGPRHYFKLRRLEALGLPTDRSDAIPDQGTSVDERPGTPPTPEPHPDTRDSAGSTTGRQPGGPLSALPASLRRLLSR